MDNINLRKAVRLNCMECNGEVKGGKKYDCLRRECYLYPWKEGKGVYEFPENIPQEHKDYIKSLKDLVKKPKCNLTDEQKKAFSERMKKAWETRKANNKLLLCSL